MAKTITLPDGSVHPCFDLIMRKENAWDILDGKKGMEFRSVSPFYVKKFLVPKTSYQKTLDACESKDVNYIHFHDYNNSWFLDVYTPYVHFAVMHPKMQKYLHLFRAHDFDEEIERVKNENVAFEDANWCFEMPIIAIVGTDLTTPEKIKATGGGLGATWFNKYFIQGSDEEEELRAAVEAIGA